jgi:acyl-CoA synthetase (AMP-forming)/AMP-acid ligase II
MSTLKEELQDIPRDQVALIGSKKEYLYGDILSLLQCNIDTLNKLQGVSVVIRGRSRLDFALLVSLLDGTVGSMLFLPSDISTTMHENFYEKTRTNYEVWIEQDRLKYNKINQYNVERPESESVTTQWIIPTSGTTSTPKLISHTFESLTRTTKRNIDIGLAYRWGLVFDIYRFSGIQVFLQSILGGSTLIITESHMSIEEQVLHLGHNKCNALSATPSFWRKILMSPEAEKLPLKRITLGGEIADQNILSALKKKFPTARITHIYASTEVGVGFAVTDGKEGFPISYLDDSLEDIRLKIDNNGILWVAPNDNNKQLLSEGVSSDAEGFIDTGDRVKIQGDRVLFLGRASGAINVGGNKVQPEEVEKVLLNCEHVQEAHVYAKSNPIMGALVCADVVLRYKNTDLQETKKAILDYCRKNLDGFKVPVMLSFVDKLQITQSGKLKR